MPEFYTATKLLSMKDINGETPAFFIVTSNRQAGKTTTFYRLCMKKMIDNKSQSLILFRYQNELKGCSQKIFDSISWRFPDYDMFDKKLENGSMHQLLIKYKDQPAEVFGYAVAINSASKLRRSSGVLSQVDRVYLDEFQAEDGRYAPDEIKKFNSIILTASRQRGVQMRYLPIYLSSNPVDVLNPYFSALGVYKRLNTDVKFLRGDGWVLEQNVNESAQDAIKQSAFARAMSGGGYIAYAADASYLLNDTTFIVDDIPAGASYLSTFFYNGRAIALREFGDMIYVGGKPDITYPQKIAVTKDDHSVDTQTLNANKYFLKWLRGCWNNAKIRFTDLEARECVMTAVAPR